MPYLDRERQKQVQRQWVAARRAEWFADKECVRCGAVDRLELHHADPAQKVSHSIWSWSEARRRAEIAKCLVLCKPCHQQHHSLMKRHAAEIRNPCGTWQAYKRGCHCQPCRDAQRRYEIARVASKASAA